MNPSQASELQRVSLREHPRRAFKRAIGCKKNTILTVFFQYSVPSARIQAVRQKPSSVLYSGTSTYAGSKSDLCIVNVTESPRHEIVTSNVSGSVQYAGQ